MQAVGLTEIGNYRQVNEDNYFVSTDPIGNLPNLFLVADGLGGHSAGDVASKITVETVVSYCQRSREKDKTDLTRYAFEEANDKVQEYSKTINKVYEMGSTLVSLSVFSKYYQIINVGDSRAYLYRKGKLTKLTKDHSLVQKLQEEGLISEEEAYTHEKRNLILQAIGMEPIVNVDIYAIPAYKNDIIMLCTDGLSNYIRREEMEKILRQEQNLKKLAKLLIDTSLENGSTDNITVVMVKNAKGSEDDLC